MNTAAIQTLQQTHTLPPLRTWLRHVTRARTRTHTHTVVLLSSRLVMKIVLMCIRKSRCVSRPFLRFAVTF